MEYQTKLLMWIYEVDNCLQVIEGIISSLSKNKRKNFGEKCHDVYYIQIVQKKNTLQREREQMLA